MDLTYWGGPTMTLPFPSPHPSPLQCQIMARLGAESLLLSPSFLGCTLVSSGDQAMPRLSEWRLERAPCKKHQEWNGHSLQDDSPFQVFELECKGVFTRFHF